MGCMWHIGPRCRAPSRGIHRGSGCPTEFFFVNLDWDLKLNGRDLLLSQAKGEWSAILVEEIQVTSLIHLPSDISL